MTSVKLLADAHEREQALDIAERKPLGRSLQLQGQPQHAPRLHERHV